MNNFYSDVRLRYSGDDRFARPRPSLVPSVWPKSPGVRLSIYRYRLMGYLAHKLFRSQNTE
jgi:hypothetical protein